MFSLRVNSLCTFVAVDMQFLLFALQIDFSNQSFDQSPQSALLTHNEKAYDISTTDNMFDLSCSCKQYNNMMSLPFYILVQRALLTYYYSLLHFNVTHHINWQTDFHRSRHWREDKTTMAVQCRAKRHKNCCQLMSLHGCGSCWANSTSVLRGAERPICLIRYRVDCGRCWRGNPRFGFSY